MAAKSFYVAPGAALDGGELGFLAYSAFVNNPSAYWYEVAPYGWVSPYTLGAVIALDGTQRINVRPGAPPPIVNTTAAGSADGNLLVVASELAAAPNPGTPYPNTPLLAFANSGGAVCTAVPQSRYLFNDTLFGAGPPAATNLEAVQAISVIAHPNNAGPCGLTMFPSTAANSFLQRIMPPGHSIDFQLTDITKVTIRFAITDGMASAIGDRVSYLALIAIG